VSSSPTDRYQRVDALFDALLDLPAPEQMPYLDRAAADEPEVYQEVVRLLQAHRRAEGFLDASRPVVARTLLEAADLLPATEVPDRIGPWRIVRQLGQGGMGAVFLGERADGQFEQRAAIKLIQGGSPGLVRRFLEERRILAMLEHPGIARLIEGGLTPGGRPYFAMELIEGMHLDRYCDEHELGIEARLELVDQVCDAVSYAHHHLVIHRDLKPSNILVTPAGRVKLLDFGIAKLLSDAPAAAQTDTRRPAMTPEFAAPEQIRGEAVSTATDVYALGVLLYVLLARRYPYEIRNKPLAELARIVCEEVPTRPSTRAPEPLRRRLRGDLDLIVMTALHKDPRRRYQSPASVAEDLRRFRAGHPIQARSDSAGYRLGKFVGRHRLGVAAAAVLVTLLAVGVVRERVLRQRAEIEARKATEVGDYLVGVFDVADPYADERRDGRDVSARTLLDQGVRRVDSVLAGQPEVQAQLRSVFGRAYTALGLFDQATPLLHRALAQHRALYGEDHVAVAEDMELLGDALMQQDRYAEAEPLLRRAVDLRRRGLGSTNDTTARALDRLATLYERRDEAAAAEPLFREALAIRRTVFGDTSTVVAQSLNNLGVLLFKRGAYERAEPLYREALEINVRQLGENHPHTSAVLHNLAGTQHRLGVMAESESLYRRALAAKRKTLSDAHPSVTVNLNNLGAVLLDLGRLDEAEALFREALALDRRMFGDQHSFVASSRGNLASALGLKGEFTEAEREYREGLRINRALFGSEHGNVAWHLNGLGNILRLRGDLPGAVRHLREAVETSRRVSGDDHQNTIKYTINLGRAVLALGGAEEAERLLRGAASHLDSTNAYHWPWYVNARTGIGLALLARGRATEARDGLEALPRFAGTHLGEGHLRTADAQLALGRALLATREYARAEPLLRAAAGTFEKQRKAQPSFAAQAEEALAELRRHRAN
jgi:tetratricopeptide (TPR) repeat protein/predicted Ser/Thr protein kinase